MKYLFFFALLASCFSAQALTVHAVELGLGKFHRMDNQLHPHGENHALAPMILPEGADLKDTPLVVQRSTEVYTVFFSSLEQLINSTIKIAKDHGSKINNFTIHAHGLPGGIFVPRSNKQRDSVLCSNWRKQSVGTDLKSYNQYYSKTSMLNIKLIKLYSHIGDSIASRILTPLLRDPCVSGLGAFERLIKNVPDFKSHFDDDLEIKFLSCSVGMGKAGQDFVQGIAKLFLSTSAGEVAASQIISLGDWSTTEGMGFWDAVSLKQVRQDNQNYVTNKRDSEIASTGSVLTGFLDDSGVPRSRVTKDLWLMTWRKE